MCQVRRDPVSDDRAWLTGRVEEIQSLFEVEQKRAEADAPYAHEPGGIRVEVHLWMPGGDTTTIRGYARDISLDRDFIDATAFGDLNKTYMRGLPTFTLRGEIRPWKTQENR